MLRLLFTAYFAAVGVSLPFFAPYLRNLGLSGRQLALMLSAAPVCHLLTPFIWGWAADRSQKPQLLLRIACLGSVLAYLPLIWVRTLPALLAVFAVHQFFAVAVPGLIDALALERVRRHGDDYGRIRIFGSISFTASCLLMSPILAARGPRGGDPLIPITLAILLGSMALLSLMLRSERIEAAKRAPRLADIRVLLRDPRLLLLLVVAPLHGACLAPYHGFFGILLQDRHLSSQVLGNAFVVSVVGEMVSFFFFRRISSRFRLSGMLTLAFAASVVRWAVVAYSQSPTILVGTQAVHALTFGLFHATAVSWLGACVPPALRATGQTLYTAAVYGIGNLIGMLAAGAIYDRTGGATAAFLTAAIIEIIPFLLMATMGRRLDPRPAPQGT